MNSILLLEDDAVLAAEVKAFLKTKIFDCDTVFNGEIVFRQLKQKSYSLLLLDVNVPGINGFEVCRKVREIDHTIPILMLTAYGDLQDKKDGFQAGADDYLVKPFHLDELLIRIQSLLRRGKSIQQTPKTLIVDDLIINLSDKSVTRNHIKVELTPKEYQLLLLLANAKGRTLSKQTIADEIWDLNLDTNLNTIEVYINFLRKKIDKNFEYKLIHTRPGYGYFLKSEML
jgi:DNA-binding response OmpR family regulator